MLKITEALVDLGMANKVFNVCELKSLFNNTPASRYGLLNKAISKGEILQLKRGVYIINQKYNSQKMSKFYLASQIVPHSYISFESALSYHGLIPEAVTVVSSVIHHGRSKEFITVVGEFQYDKIPVQQYEFLTGVHRVAIDGQPFLMASGLRALLDLVYKRGYKWQGLDFIQDSLRIDIDDLMTISLDDYKEIARVYRSKRVLNFLQQMRDQLFQICAY